MMELKLNQRASILEFLDKRLSYFKLRSRTSKSAGLSLMELKMNQRTSILDSWVKDSSNSNYGLTFCNRPFIIMEFKNESEDILEFLGKRLPNSKLRSRISKSVGLSSVMELKMNQRTSILEFLCKRLLNF